MFENGSTLGKLEDDILQDHATFGQSISTITVTRAVHNISLDI